MSPIFISYRRSDSADITGRIYDRLSQHFGKDAVFKDVSSIPYGVDFRQKLDQALSSCKVVLAIIGPSWLEVTDDKGNRRIDDPKDWVRLELETALQNEIPILPIQVGGARTLKATDLPMSLRPMAHRNAAQARPDPDFHIDIDRLIRSLEEQFGSIKASRQDDSNLAADSKTPMIWLHGWDSYKPLGGEDSADHELDWSAHYHKPSTSPDVADWEKYFAPQLRALKQKVDAEFSSQVLEFRSTLPLAPTLAVGHAFSRAGHYKLRIKQNDEIWQSYDVAASSLQFNLEKVYGQSGNNLLIGFGVTGNAWPKIEELLKTAPKSFNATVYAQVPKPGSTSITNADAIALATQAKDLMRQYQQKYKASCIHLVVFAPAAYALFLGQYLNQLGEIIAYEYKGTGYQPAVKINT